MSCFDKIEDLDEFLVINMDTSYNLLPDRHWMHKYAVVLSTYHQYVKYPYREEMGL